MLPGGVGAKRVGWIIRGSHGARNDAVLLGPRSTVVVAGFAMQEDVVLLGRDAFRRGFNGSSEALRTVGMGWSC